MKIKTKKIIGLAGVIATLGVLTACNSFCSEADESAFRYGYDPINTMFFDTREDALTFLNTKVTEGYKELTLDTKIKDKNGNEINVISDKPFDGYNVYYIHPSVLKLESIKVNSDGKHVYKNMAVGKNGFVASLETTATSSNINLPYNEFYEDLDKFVLDEIYNTAIASKDAIYSNLNKTDLTFKDIYGYTFEDFIEYRKNGDDKLLEKMLKGDDNGYIGRNNAILVKYGYSKFYQKDSPKQYYTKLSVWNNKIYQNAVAENFSDASNYAMNSDFMKIYQTNLTTKIGALKTCISIDDGMYGHISNDPLNETVPIENKAENGFWTSWGEAFTKHGFLEGLLVYPISYGVETLSHAFGLNGWGQVWSVLLVTIIIRFVFMFITLPSTISQQKMTFLQPELAKLQQKYPNANTNQYEKQRLAQAQMALYKKNKVHPFRSMLVMVVQFPLFIAVWNAMTGSASLSSDSVLGLYLSDTVWQTLTNATGWPALPGWWTALVLVLLMSGSQIVSMMLPQWLSKRRIKKTVTKTVVSSTQNDAQKQTKIMSYVMTAFVIIMGFTLPSAMGVYWFAGALFSIVQTLLTQTLIAKKYNKDR